MKVSGQLRGPRRFNSGERAHLNPLDRKLSGPRVNAVEKALCPCWESKPDSKVIKPVT
jgi:hypothetical protein